MLCMQLDAYYVLCRLQCIRRLNMTAWYVAILCTGLPMWEESIPNTRHDAEEENNVDIPDHYERRGLDAGKVHTHRVSVASLIPLKAFDTAKPSMAADPSRRLTPPSHAVLTTFLLCVSTVAMPAPFRTTVLVSRPPLGPFSPVLKRVTTAPRGHVCAHVAIEV